MQLFYCFILQEAFTAFHPDKKYVRKFLKPLCIGQIPVEHQQQVIILLVILALDVGVFDRQTPLKRTFRDLKMAAGSNFQQIQYFGIFT